MEKLKSLNDTFDRVSNEVLGKSIKYKQNILFHLLRKIGKELNMEDFYIKGSKSTKRLDEEIGKYLLDWDGNLDQFKNFILDEVSNHTQVQSQLYDLQIS